MKTLDYIQITPGDAATGPRPDDFTPWKSDTATPREEIRRLALHKYLRESGALNRRAAFVGHLTLTVYHYRHGDPCHPNGRPMTVTATTYGIRKP